MQANKEQAAGEGAPGKGLSRSGEAAISVVGRCGSRSCPQTERKRVIRPWARIWAMALATAECECGGEWPASNQAHLAQGADKATRRRMSVWAMALRAPYSADTNGLQHGDGQGPRRPVVAIIPTATTQQAIGPGLENLPAELASPPV